MRLELQRLHGRSVGPRRSEMVYIQAQLGTVEAVRSLLQEGLDEILRRKCKKSWESREKVSRHFSMQG